MFVEPRTRTGRRERWWWTDEPEVRHGSRSEAREAADRDLAFARLPSFASGQPPSSSRSLPLALPRPAQWRPPRRTTSAWATSLRSSRACRTWMGSSSCSPRRRRSRPDHPRRYWRLPAHRAARRRKRKRRNQRKRQRLVLRVLMPMPMLPNLPLPQCLCCTLAETNTGSISARTTYVYFFCAFSTHN